MPLQATSGAASYDAFGGGVPVVPAYIEECFSCFLYTGNGSTQTITNGIDLSTKGGLAWLKMRNFNQGHILFDTIRGVENYLQSASSDEQYNLANSLTAFNTTGFSVGSAASVNTEPYVSWSFSKQPKFFDMVSWTGSGSNRTISHSLGSVPGCIMVKRTDVAANWQVYHRSLANTEYLVLNTTAAKATGATRWNSTTPTSTEFSLGTDATVNNSGSTYVAYLFAHDAGGFGLTGTDNVISCGTFDANLDEVINLGYEPQWLLYKDSSSVSNWRIADTMRGLTNLAGTNAQTIQQLSPNTSSAESANSGPVLTSTGFTWNQSGGGNKHIYIAIRRGPMKVPTDATKVFAPYVTTSNSSSGYNTYNAGFVTDIAIQRNKSGVDGWYTGSRLQGTRFMKTETTAAETNSPGDRFDSNFGAFAYSASYGLYAFQRAPSFMDVVCYTGDSTAGRSVNHNLGVEPELMIVKTRSGTTDWQVYAQPLGVTTGSGLLLNSSDAAGYNTVNGFYATPTSSVFYLGTGARTNVSSATYVNYLFATCAGVSKVGSYTGNGGTQTINCGFTGGARFVLIKQTDSTGDWYVYDTSRGMTVLTDPYLRLNLAGAEVATLGSVTTVSTGFALDATIVNAINANGGTYIFLAIA